jgi:acetyltransferase-like isoleucine patch superfamily enzyme
MSKGKSSRSVLNSPLNILTGLVKNNFMQFIYFGNDKVRYMRWLGMKVGEGCQFFNRIEGFGSEPWLIEIRNYVILAGGVQFITHDGASRLYRKELPGSSKYGNRFGRILIHDECFIGMNSIIMPDVEIGPYSIVGVGSIVNKNVPPRMVYAGVPAKPICTFDEYFTRYKESMIKISSDNREELRRELTSFFWGEER